VAYFLVAARRDAARSARCGVWSHCALLLAAAPLGALATAATTAALAPLGLPVLTFPFCFVTWAVLLAASGAPLSGVELAQCAECATLEEKVWRLVAQRSEAQESEARVPRSADAAPRDVQAAEGGGGADETCGNGDVELAERVSATQGTERQE